MDRLIEKLNNIPNKYKPVPFWSWNNELDEEELRKQIRYMHDSGLGGFFIHARTGLKTPYMGEKWYKCIDACIDEAIKLNMDVWFYDENGWPSGFVGGELLNDEYNLCRFLAMKEEKSFSKEALSCFVKDDGFKVADENTKADTFYNVYEMKDASNTDILNPVVVDRFISATHEEYKKRYSKYFGNVVKGFFTDEPQFSRDEIPYTPAVRKLFKERYGYDAFDYLIYLFNTNPEGYSFRHDYYKLIAELYTTNFIKKIHDWCDDNNLMITGHTIDETTFMGQLCCTMGVMPFYEYEHIPGIDWLGRVVSHDMTTRQVGSVASQLGRGQVLTETFAMTGWNVNPLELKHILDYQFLGGANLLCQHLMSYSLKGQGKKDHPPTCGYQIPWTDEYRILNEYATRLGYILATTDDVVDTLVLHPIRSGFFFCDKLGNGEKVAELDNDFRIAVDELTKSSIYHHYGDETIIEHLGKVDGDRFVVGKRSYKYVVVPYMLTISSHNLKLIEEFIANGGKIYFRSIPEYVDGKERDLSYLKSNITLKEIADSETIKITGDMEELSFIRKTGELGNFLFILNKSCVDNKKITVKVKAESAEIIDLEKLKFFNIDYKKDGEYIIFHMELLASHSAMIELDRKSENVFDTIRTVKEQSVKEKFNLIPSDKNILTLDKASYSLDGGKTFSKEYYMYAITEKLLKEKFNGKLLLRQTFNLADKCDIKLLIEKEKYLNFKVNGKEIKFAPNSIDIFALSGDITDALVIGENVIEYTIDYYNRDDVRHVLYDPFVKESLKNCLAFDTELESIYLYGNFEVVAEKIGTAENNAVLTKPEFTIKKAEIKKLSPLVTNGYPFYSGKIHYKGEIAKCDAKKIMVNGDIMAFDLIINGEFIGKGVFDNFVNIENKLNKEINQVEIVATISLRNTLGPHHLNTPEPMWVSPHSFTMTGSWNDDKNMFYVPDYAFVDSGVSEIKLLFS